MTTDIGVELTEKEVKLVKDLQRLATRWKKDGGRLWLFSASGTLTVMMNGNIPSNPEPEMLANNSVNQNNIVTTINGIQNDGGDW